MNKLIISLIILLSLVNCNLKQEKNTKQIKIEKDTILEQPFDTIVSSPIVYDTLHIIGRDKWNAKNPTMEMTKHEIQKITIHHDGFRIELNVVPENKMRSLQNFSQKETILGNGKKKEAWADVPYHYVIFPKGEIFEGRLFIYAGDTNTEYNPEGHLLIDIAGNFQEQEPTEEQITELKKMCLYFCQEYNISYDLIKGHNDYAHTACPGKNLSNKLPEIRDYVTNKIANTKIILSQ